MTAPLTPPHQPPPHDSAWPAPEPVPPASGGAPSTATELRQSAVVVAASVAGGLLLGLLWLWLAPRVTLFSDGKAVYLKNSEGESAIGMDGTFVLLALGFGALAAALVFLIHRHGGIALVLGLAAGGVLGSLLAWGVGVWFGPDRDVVGHAKAVGPDVVFEAPLELKMGAAALLAWPIAAMLVHLGLTALFGPRDPEPEDDGTTWTEPAPHQTPPAAPQG
ncbi:DUF2567 domain-containing protein [Streptomyces roseicoloratus]|uniref:DUF2567 domain-containing protein n=1 Tax=Streptomyces roseicoloratus TaxID=2508722 RepID=UPI001009BC7E|nr:DUF2567 domain-containing protein [Streptomyces roseicoloratus]